MKKVVITFYLILFYCSYLHAQSVELKQAFNAVCETIKDYKFISEDSNECGNIGKTLRIQFQVQKGSLIFIFNDDFGDFTDPIFGYRQGTKVIKVPIKDAKFEKSSYGSYLYITSINRENIELIYNDKLEIIPGYEIYGADGSLEKLKKELDDLLFFLKIENFNGTLIQRGKRKSMTIPSSKKYPRFPFISNQ